MRRANTWAKLTPSIGKYAFECAWRAMTRFNSCSLLHRTGSLGRVFLEQLECPQRAAGRDVHQIGIAGLQGVHAANSAGNGHVLFAVLLPGNGLADDARRRLELPQN